MKRLNRKYCFYFLSLVFGFSTVRRKMEAKRLVNTINHVSSGTEMDDVVMQSKLFVLSLKVRALLMLVVQFLVIVPNLFLAYKIYTSQASYTPTGAVFLVISIILIVFLFYNHLYEIKFYSNATVLAYHAHILDYLTQQQVIIHAEGAEWQCWQIKTDGKQNIASGIDQLQAASRAFEKLNPKSGKIRFQA